MAAECTIIKTSAKRRAASGGETDTAESKLKTADCKELEKCGLPLL